MYHNEKNINFYKIYEIYFTTKVRIWIYNTYRKCDQILMALCPVYKIRIKRCLERWRVPERLLQPSSSLQSWRGQQRRHCSPHPLSQEMKPCKKDRNRLFKNMIYCTV
jgi:hypothetical protein